MIRERTGVHPGSICRLAVEREGCATRVPGRVFRKAIKRSLVRVHTGEFYAHPSVGAVRFDSACCMKKCTFYSGEEPYSVSKVIL